jgi:hypothetical protein
VSDTPSPPKVVRDPPCLPGPAFFGISLNRRHVTLAFVLTSLVVVGGAFYWGVAYHPDYTSPRGQQAQARIVDVFGSPGADDAVVVGDYAVERFYAMDPATGRFFVADLCKGRVRNIIEWTRDDGTLGYTLDLDRRGLQGSELRRISALVEPPVDGATYLGLKIQAGNIEAIPLNYDGRLPRQRSEFRSPLGQDADTYLRGIAQGAWRPGTHLVNTDGTNFVLTSTDVYPYFSAMFGMRGLLLLSRLEFVDDSGVSPGPSVNPSRLY